MTGQRGAGPERPAPRAPQVGRPGRAGRMQTARFAGRQPAGAAAGHAPGRLRAAVLGLAVLGLVAGGAWAVLGSSLLAVRHVEVTGNHLVPTSEVLAAAGLRPGTPLARLNTGMVTERIEQITQVQSARVTRSWPDTVVISVRERTPALAVPAHGRFELIDGDGVVVRWSRLRPASLPLLRSAPAVLRGSPAIQSAVAVLASLPAPLRARVESVTATAASAVSLRLRGGVTVRWGNASGAAAKAAELAVLLRTSARTIDVSDPATAVTGG